MRNVPIGCGHRIGGDVAGETTVAHRRPFIDRAIVVAPQDVAASVAVEVPGLGDMTPNYSLLSISKGEGTVQLRKAPSR